MTKRKMLPLAVPEEGSRKALKRCLLKVLIRPPIIGELYRFHVSPKAYMNLRFEEQLSETLVMVNITSGNEEKYKFRMDDWLRNVKEGIAVHQPWFTELDF